MGALAWNMPHEVRPLHDHWLCKAYSIAAVNGDTETLHLLAQKLPLSVRVWDGQVDEVEPPSHPHDAAMAAAVHDGDSTRLRWMLTTFRDAGWGVDPTSRDQDHCFQKLTAQLVNDRAWILAFLRSVVDAGAGAVLQFGPHHVYNVAADGVEAVAIPAHVDFGGLLGRPSIDVQLLCTTACANHEVLLALVSRPLPATRSARVNRLTYLADSVFLQEPDNYAWFEDLLIEDASGAGALNVLCHLELRAREIGFFELAAAAGSTLAEALRAGLEFGDHLERVWKDRLKKQVDLIQGRRRLWAALRTLPKLLAWARRARLKLDAPGEVNHLLYCAQYSAFPFAG